VIHSATEAQSAYCAFGGNSPCAAWPAGQWNALAPGVYTITVEAESAAGLPSVAASITFIRLP
jgi:hypothetical protein